jgi:hypothetical protein
VFDEFDCGRIAAQDPERREYPGKAVLAVGRSG